MGLFFPVGSDSVETVELNQEGTFQVSRWLTSQQTRCENVWTRRRTSGTCPSSRTSTTASPPSPTLWSPRLASSQPQRLERPGPPTRVLPSCHAAAARQGDGLHDWWDVRSSLFSTGPTRPGAGLFRGSLSLTNPCNYQPSSMLATISNSASFKSILTKTKLKLRHLNMFKGLK